MFFGLWFGFFFGWLVAFFLVGFSFVTSCTQNTYYKGQSICVFVINFEESYSIIY